MRCRIVCAIVISVSLAGCGSFFPGFEGPLGLYSWIHRVPVKRAALQVQCELLEFLEDPKNSAALKLLDPIETAGLNLVLSSDHAGTVSYVGIDLNKLGFVSLAQLITVANNNAPSLQAGGTAKGSISSQIDFTIPQTAIGAKTDPKFVLDSKTGQIKREKEGKFIKGIRSSYSPVCSGPLGDGLAFPLGLRAWLTNFFEHIDSDRGDLVAACMTKITLKTQFQLIFNIKAGFNPLIGNSFIVPISGLNGEFNPAHTHSLQIVFALNKKNPRICRDAVAKSAPQPDLVRDYRSPLPQ